MSEFTLLLEANEVTENLETFREYVAMCFAKIVATENFEMFRE